MGRLIAENGFVLVNGGLKGVMEASARGAKAAGGWVIGILPGRSALEANSFTDIAIPTGLGYLRNALVVLNSDVLVAIDGSYGTLSEIAYTQIYGKKIFGIETWDIPASSPWIPRRRPCSRSSTISGRRNKEGKTRMTNNYRVVVHFDGTEYYGWQFQTAEYPTIQAELIRILKIIAKKQVLVTGSSRTDAGVHSSGLTANFHLPVAIEPDSLKRALNSLLPRDIRIVECELMDKSFNARFGAVSKTYVYRIFTGQVQSPFSQRFALHVPFPLDLKAMRKAARHFVGTRDFYVIQLRRTGKEKDPRSGQLQNAGQERRDHLHRARQKLPALHGAQHGRHPDRRRPGQDRRERHPGHFRRQGPPPRRADGPGQGADAGQGRIRAERARA